MVTTTAAREQTAYAVVAGVLDPEVPVITIAELGILRSVEEREDRVVVTITPTYSGCPAMDTIRDDVIAAAAAAGLPPVEVRTVLSPAWTTDWITAAGRAKLRDFGIAPPNAAGPVLLQMPRVRPIVACPQCGSEDTHELSRFGSTACKALWQCSTCQEPFDYFKAI